MSVTRRYWYQNGWIYLTTFSTVWKPLHFSFLWHPAPISNSFSRGVKYTGVGKIGDFRRKSPFISETVRPCEIGRWLLWNVLGCRIEWYNFRWHWGTRNPGFKVTHCIGTSRISQKRCVLGTKLLKNTNMKPYTIYRMIPLSMTLSDLWPRFQGHDIFRHWISETTRDRAIYSYYRTSIESLMRSIAWWYFQWPWRTTNSVSRSQHFWSRISKKKRFILGTVFLHRVS